ncbi:MAG: 50S ribosomal protein L28 [Armatimonadota bacterium]
MAKKCEICGKGPATGTAVTHSNIKTKRRWLPNLQTATLIIEGQKKKMKVCTRCIRTNKKKVKV